MTEHADQTTMRDPLTQYPRPDFEKQPQPAPGLAREMRRSRTTASKAIAARAV